MERHSYTTLLIRLKEIGSHRSRNVRGGYDKENVSTGASSDLQQVYNVAKDMVASYGFGQSVGKLSLTNRQLSPETMYCVEKEMSDIVRDCYDETLEALQTHRAQLDALTNKLLDDEIVDGDFVYDLLLQDCRLD